MGNKPKSKTAEKKSDSGLAEPTGRPPTAKAPGHAPSKKGAAVKADSKAAVRLPGKTSADATGTGKKGDASRKGTAPRPPATGKNGAWIEGLRPHTHWDYVLMEMKWMAVDFMQERRWTLAAAAHFANLSADAGRGRLENAGWKEPGSTAPRQLIPAPLPGPMADATARPEAEARAVEAAEACKVEESKADTAEKPEEEAELEKGPVPMPERAADQKDTAEGKGNSGDQHTEDVKADETISKSMDSEAQTKEAEETKSNGDVVPGEGDAEAASCGVKAEAAEAQDTLKPQREEQPEAGPRPWAASGAAWCLSYHCKPTLSKAVLAKICILDDKRSLTQDLRVQEYRLDYEAACASVTLAQQVAREEAARIATEQAAERQRLEAEEEIQRRNQKRIKKKTKAGVELEEELAMEDARLKKPMLTVNAPIPGVNLGKQRAQAIPRTPSGALASGLLKAEEAKNKKGKEKKRRLDSITLDADLDTVMAEVDNKAGRTPSEVLGGKKGKKAKTKISAATEPAAAAERANKTRKPGVPSEAVPWSAHEDQLLFAIVMEFGQNWALNADVLGNTTSVTGVFRRADHCRSRWKMLSQQSNEGTLDASLVDMKATKGAPREFLGNAMPVPESVLVRRMTVLASVGNRLSVALDTERARKQEANGQRHIIHASHGSIEVKHVHANGGKHLTPLELVELANQVVVPNSQSLLLQQPSMQPSSAAAAGSPAAAPGAMGAQAVAAAAAGTAGGVQSGQVVAAGQHQQLAMARAAGHLQAGQQHMGAAAAGAVQPGLASAVSAMPGATQAGQILPAVPRPTQAGMVLGAQGQVLPGAVAASPAALQAAILARQQQQQGLTPQQHQQLLAQLQAQHAQAQAVAHQQAIASGAMTQGQSGQLLLQQQQQQQQALVQHGSAPMAAQAQAQALALQQQQQQQVALQQQQQQQQRAALMQQQQQQQQQQAHAHAQAAAAQQQATAAAAAAQPQAAGLAAAGSPAVQASAAASPAAPPKPS